MYNARPRSGGYCNLKLPAPWNRRHTGTSMSKNVKWDTKQLRAIGHKLKPVVAVAGNGLTENVLSELNRALTDHELIKVKLAVGSKEARKSVATEICEQTKAELVQSIGNIIVIVRRSEKPDPKLSNLIKRG